MKLFENGRLLLIAGPCVVESRDSVFRIAEALKKLTADRPVDFFFKASYDKANRTSVESFRGPGMEESLAILAEAKREFDLFVDTDVHESRQVPVAAEVVDMIQIPAFLCRQTDLLLAAGATGKPVMVKKGQFAAPEDMEHVVDKVIAGGGGGQVALCERGTTFGYRNLVVDYRSLPIMRQFAPVVFDGTHSVQRPAGLGGRSGGDRHMIPYLVRAAAAVGIDGLFIETHHDPDQALSDGPNMIPLKDLPALLDTVDSIRER
ncbi:MAG: 3-deoxy-8-phosphooctulonate synthase [Planctomycetota bacterium]